MTDQTGIGEVLAKAIAERDALKLERDCLQEHFDGADDAYKERDAALAMARKLEAEKQTVCDMALTESKRMESALNTERSVNRHLQARLAVVTTVLLEVHQDADDLCNGAPGTNEMFYRETRDKIAALNKVVGEASRAVDNTQHTDAEDTISAAVKKITWAALDLLQSDPHQWSTRPCPTCNAISSLVGRNFGCVVKRLSADRKAAGGGGS